jgi:CTP:molybdopterin cytidylyltransferase MocA
MSRKKAAASEPPQIAAIVLAAGMSRRMGQLKPLLPFGDKPMLARVLEVVCDNPNIAPILVVTGHAEEEIRPIANIYTPDVVFNPDYAAGGMLSSVQAGARALPSDCDACFLMLGDQPMVRPQTLRSLAAAWQETQAPITLPTYEGQRGHPVLFAATCLPEILALSGTETLKTVVTRHMDELREVPVSDPSVVMDVDTPEDYERALRFWKARTGEQSE